ncbi:MAG: GNAT family N-acetyltransferase [Leptolyngbyaceae cyanobacterium SM2_5_2]|nr:GNAT family N-acetyltransferase [Leptolyngbyaceae cyanobacterium SM2_5_2]
MLTKTPLTKTPRLTSARLILRMGKPADIPAILDYYEINRQFLEPFEPQRPADFYTASFWHSILEMRQQDFYEGHSIKLFIFEQAHPTAIIGTLNLNSIVLGAFHGANLGYGLSAQKQGQGYMTEAGARIVTYAFDVLNLHRLMAAYMPHNHRSANVLKRLGFQIEGLAKDYLCIDGQWQDHVMTSLINPNWQTPEFS